MQVIFFLIHFITVFCGSATPTHSATGSGLRMALEERKWRNAEALDLSKEKQPARSRSGRNLRIRHQGNHSIFHFGGVTLRNARQTRYALQDMSRPLKRWLIRNRDHPYPSKTEKAALATGSHMTLVQVSNWFANARRRLKKTVRGLDLTWGQRVRLYNSYVSGNAEPLSISSDDSIWESDSDGDIMEEREDDRQQHREHTEHSYFAVDEQTKSNDDEVRKRRYQVKLPSDFSDDSAAVPTKYKSLILHRYLQELPTRKRQKISLPPTDCKRRRMTEEEDGFQKSLTKNAKQELEREMWEMEAAQALTALCRNTSSLQAVHQLCTTS